MGRVCSVKRKKRKTRGAPLHQAIWCCSFLYMYQGKGKVTKKWNRSGYTEDHDSRFALYCFVHLRAGIEHCTNGW